MKHQVLFLFLCIILHTEGKQKPINIALSGKWNSTPILLEASEFLAKESSEKFWLFVDQVSKEEVGYIETASDEVVYMIVQKHSAQLLSPLQLSLLKFSISLRAFSPTVQMYQQLAEQVSFHKNCEAFIEVNGQYTCDPNDLSQLLTTAQTRPKSVVYQFDHVHLSPAASSPSSQPVVVMFGQLGTASFNSFYPVLADLSTRGEITLVLRHFLKKSSQTKVRLSGYGVELAIKSTEYKAKDDTKVEDKKGSSSEDFEDEDEDVQGLKFSKLKELHPELKDNLKEFRNHLIDSATELSAFKVWQLQELGSQATAKILSAPVEDSLRLLRDISQNFPTQARSLLRVPVSAEFKKELQKNQKEYDSMGAQSGESLLFLNGLQMDMELYDIFSLLDTMMSEAQLVEGLHSLDLQGEDLQRFLQLDLKETEELSYGVDIRHAAVQYLNDLDTDKRYRGWPGSVQDLLRPSFPGMLRHVAKNLFHLVFIVDPSTEDGRTLLKTAEAFYVHKAPLRLGLVLVTSTDKQVDVMKDPGIALTKAFTFISNNKSIYKALSFLTDLYEKYAVKDLTADVVHTEFLKKYPKEDKELVFADNGSNDDIRNAGTDFISNSGLTELPVVLMNGVPLDREQIRGDAFEESVVMETLKQTNVLQKAAYRGDVSDDMDILDWWMERNNILPRLNSRVLAPPSLRLDFSGKLDKDAVKTGSVASALSSRDLTAAITDGMKYLTKKDDKDIKPVSMWVVADLETSKGRELLYSAIKHIKQSNDARLGVIFNTKSYKKDSPLSKSIYTALQSLPMPLAKSLVTKLVKEENAEALNDGSKMLEELEVHGMNMAEYMTLVNSEPGDFLEVHQTFASKVLHLKPGDMAIITNGGMLGPLGADEEFLVEDINLLDRLALRKGGGKVRDATNKLSATAIKTSDTVMKIYCLLTSKDKQEERRQIRARSDKHTVLKIPADKKIPAFTIEAIVDPLSREAQKMTPILMALKEMANVDITIYFNPRDKLSEMPLKSFYRYVIHPEVTFNGEGALSVGPSARFLDMPQKSLLTLNMDTPESWLVEAVTSPYDLDNILLEEVEKSVNADFELEYILLEGHCHDASTMQPPRGLQFVLGTASQPAKMDTIVMANLGYFQLKANPGLWRLQLREGRSKDIYQVDSHEQTDTPTGSQEVVVAIDSFKSKIIRVKVSKKPDKMEDTLLQDDSEEEAGIWDSISRRDEVHCVTPDCRKRHEDPPQEDSYYTGKLRPSKFTGSTTTEEDSDETVNIFSVASGHLYERFLRIMMLSVLKNTKSKVKFWFLKNYLSPTFKHFIPHMAQEYGFEYELVQYKWPRWLNQQKEKQRIIWGYKILFLDVLFPLDVKKIIFVDADQIVRTDLQDLVDFDLGGAPYGYTPFCDSRKEMDGFRFWNSGYWKSHLSGRRYHISALYVVDLKKFRRIAAGDRLRGQYQGLSQDPNSLANLDQDLPNNMIHQVSIKSLPQEWLYCETWCSTDEKARAKTIDLCNNPLTKEPKLQAAMRIVPEWKDYDYEIKVLWDEIYHTNTKAQIEYEPPDLSNVKDIRKKKKEEL